VNPIPVVSLYDDHAGLCGPNGGELPVYWDIDDGQADRVCDAALDDTDTNRSRPLAHFLPSKRMMSN
jgi:hypothetical protein